MVVRSFKGLWHSEANLLTEINASGIHKFNIPALVTRSTDTTSSKIKAFPEIFILSLEGFEKI